MRRNRIKCAACDDVIESTHRHDLQWCKCGAVAVDGGQSYFKRCGQLEHIIELNDDDTPLRREAEIFNRR